MLSCNPDLTNFLYQSDCWCNADFRPSIGWHNDSFESRSDWRWGPTVDEDPGFSDIACAYDTVVPVSIRRPLLEPDPAAIKCPVALSYIFLWRHFAVETFWSDTDLT
jgi:hypothetical protein